MKNLIFSSMLFIFITNSCNVKMTPHPHLGQVDYFDKLYKFKNEFEIRLSEDGYGFIFKNASKQTIYINTSLSSFSSDKLVSLYNDADITYRLPIVISPIKSDSMVIFDCKEFSDVSNKAQTLHVFWVYDFSQFSKKISKIERLEASNYKLESVDFKKIEGLAFIEIDKISFCSLLVISMFLASSLTSWAKRTIILRGQPHRPAGVGVFSRRPQLLD